ncbi:hypothetical protein ABTE86_10940 [Acinetobacter baumannii]
MKKIILLGLFLCSVASAEDRLEELGSSLSKKIYVYEDEIGSTLLTAKESSDQQLQKVKTINMENNLLDWKINCTKDRFNGVKSCSLNKAYRDVMVTIIDGRYGVYIGRNHFPRSLSAIKIDENTPISGYEGVSKTPLKVIEQMKKGKIAYTRYKEWPYEYNKDGEVELEGFAKKFEEMKLEYKGL